jgi:hypothetical protein
MIASVGSPSGPAFCELTRELGCIVRIDPRYATQMAGLSTRGRGVPVPAWMIEHPEWITSAKIGDMFGPVLRNCMIEIMTPERFVKTGEIERVCEDETGILWRSSGVFAASPSGPGAPLKS